MSPKLIAPVAAIAALFAVAPAHADSWNEKISMCAAAAEDEGIVDLSEYRSEFDGGTSRRMALLFTPVNGGETIEVECRIARGRVVSVSRTA